MNDGREAQVLPLPPLIFQASQVTNWVQHRSAKAAAFLGASPEFLFFL
jgi:hypothetical protein